MKGTLPILGSTSASPVIRELGRCGCSCRNAVQQQVWGERAVLTEGGGPRPKGCRPS